MNINISSGRINRNLISGSKNKILLIGPAIDSTKAREIILPSSLKEVSSLYGSNSDLYEAYNLLDKLNAKNVYVCNCYSNSDYIRLMDKVIHYDFDFLVPIGINFSDKFYNSILDKDQYFSEYMLEQLATVNSLTTIVMTEKHASLYEDFDHFTTSMSEIENDFMNLFPYKNSNFLDNYGNNLLFIYNNLKDVAYANVVLAGLFVSRDYSKYLPNLKMCEAVFDLDNIDVFGLRAMYFKNNTYANTVTVENTFNFRKTQDIYSNALIDHIIKLTIKSIDLDHYKGKLYNQYTALQIESNVNKILKDLKDLLYKEYVINNISFKKTDLTAGCIIIDFSIIPYGTLETINVIMGV